VLLTAYATSRHVERSTMTTASLIAILLELATLPLFGALSDRIGRKPVYLFGAGLHVAIAFPFFTMVQTGNVVLILLAWVLGYAVANGALFATQPAFFSELFGTSVRYSGISIGYQFSAVVAGGLAPFVATGLVASAGGATWPVSVYWTAVGAITFITTLFCRETAYRRVTGTSDQPAAKR
jgi:MFS family permease